MPRFECEFEAEVLAAVSQSRWPERVEAALRAHAVACPVCADVAAVAIAVDASNQEMRAAIATPDSGLVWWRAQRRAKREAAKAAGRPITAIQVLALACSAGLLGACFGATSGLFQAALRWVQASIGAVNWKALLASAGALMGSHAALGIGMAIVLLLTPAAAYLMRKD
ncbi:MAG TPA: hypothetical protein VMU19_10475 [Bryobacteraceae bacterium]|nr:hypothetical protein [Bryobacteraceae bacterium]